jgi:type VI secretion system secreted protein VgrG
MSNLTLTFASGESSLSVSRFAVQEGISSLFTVAIWALSDDPSIDLDTIVGQDASFRAQSGVAHAPLGGARYWTGICEHMSLVRAETTGKSTYHIRIVPRLWLLTQRRGHRIFQHLTIPDIVDQLLVEWAIAPTWKIQRNRYPKLEYKAQYGESDHDFLMRLLEEAGIAFTFPDDEKKGSQITLDDAPHTRAARAAPPILFTDNPSGVPGKEVVTHVELGHDVRPGAHVIRDFDFRNPSFALLGNATPAPAPEDRYEQFEYLPGAFDVASPGPSDTGAADDKGRYRHEQSAGDALAQRSLEGERVQKRAVAFETNTVDLWPGAVFSIAQHPHPELAAPLLVTGFFFEGAPGEVWRMSGTAVPTAAPFRPPAVTRKPRVHGVQSALVVGPGADEIHTDEFGRVRVQFPWDRQGAYDERSSVWMRVSQAWAGTGFGMITIPRVGQEVLVGFLDGDPDQPIVVGRLFDLTNPVPYKLPDNKTREVWKSSTSPSASGYNEIILEDLAGSEVVFQQAQKNLRRLVKHDETITVVHDREKDVAHDETDTTVGTRFEETDGDRVEEIGGSRTTAVRKDLAELVEEDFTERTIESRITFVGGDDHAIVKDEKRERVHLDDHVRVEGNRNESFGGYSLTAATQQEKIAKKNELETQLALHQKAGTSYIGEGAASVTLKGPGGFIQIDPGGVTIVGTLVMINVSGSPGSAPDAKPATPADPDEAVVNAPPGKTLQKGPVITSQTVATSPANRARTRIGVGEEVTLTVTPGPATWAITSGGGTLSPAGNQTTTTFTAADKTETVVITATGATGTASITFSVTEPTSWTQKRQPGTNVGHWKVGRPQCGWKGLQYAHPNDVNFYRVEWREMDSQFVANGSYMPFNGDYHGRYPPPDRGSPWFPLTHHTDADGSTDNAPDNVNTGDTGPAATGAAPPFNPGYGYFPITQQWRVGGTGAIHTFPVVLQEAEVFADGRCESRKGGNIERTMYSDPVSNP